MVPALVPRRQTPDSSVGTGPPLGHGSVATDGLGAGELVTIAAVVAAGDVAGVLAPPHPPTIKTARTNAPFRISLLLPGRARAKVVEQLLVDSSLVPSWELLTGTGALRVEVGRSSCSGHPRRQLGAAPQIELGDDALH